MFSKIKNKNCGENLRLIQSCKLSSMVYRTKIHTTLKQIPIRLDNDIAGVINKLQDGSISISFRGYCNIIELRHILDIREKHLENSDLIIHKGFYNRFMEMEDKISNVLDGEIDKCGDLIFSGHSMGGSLALIASYNYLNRYYEEEKIIRCHIFGTPKTGNKNFINYLSKNLDELVCVEIDKDIVPKIKLNSKLDGMTNILSIKDSYKYPMYDLIFNHSCTNYYYQLMNQEFQNGCDLYL